jgi:hypothetical protein
MAPVFQRLRRYFIICELATIIGVLAGPPSYAQGTTANPAASGTPLADTKPATTNPPATPWSQDLNKYPGLLPEIAQLGSKLRENVTLPAPRTDSHLLALLPDSTTVYAAAPNYGDTVRQSLAILREELKQSEVLRDWWTHGQTATAAPEFEDTLDKVSQLYQHLGDETVFFTTTDPQRHEKNGFLLFAEIRKPGLEAMLRQWLGALPGAAKPFAQVFDSKQLAAAEDLPKGQQQLVILVRPDFLVVSFDLPTVRNFDAYLTSAKREFASSPFGRRVSEGYAGGVTLLAAADLHALLKQLPLTTKESQESLQRSGFADLQYLVWRHGPMAGEIVSQGELSFTAPRHGAAAWLAKPAPLGSLDFLSPKAPVAIALNLTNLSQIFDDTQQIAGPANAGAFAAVAIGEKALNLKLKEDLLNQLSGEIAFELDNVNAGEPVWKTILKVNDAERVQKTLATLLTAAHLTVQQTENGGVTFNTVHVATQKPMDISYAIANGYLVVASRSDALAEAFQLHGSADSLAKSQKFVASLPPGQSSDASAVFYENPLAGAAAPLKDLPSQFGEILKRYAQDAPPSITRVYGEPTAIREMSASTGLDLTAALVGTAIAIPNLLRSRIAANEATAVGSLRTVNTAEIAYSVRYNKIGFARDLASLGRDAKDPTADSSKHAGMITDESLASAACTGNAPCTKSGYEFRLTTPCKDAPCKEYIVIATPVSAGTGTRTFCSTSDAVLHAKSGPPAATPVTVSECRAWPPLH